MKVFPGDVLHFVTWGGGGWGDPLERDPALVELEVRRGLVTDEGARRYGVVVGDALPAATEALAGGDAGSPSRRAAGVRHGPAARGAAGALRGGDRPARPTPPAVDVRSP